MTRELAEDPMWRALPPDMRDKPLYQMRLKHDAERRRTTHKGCGEAGE